MRCYNGKPDIALQRVLDEHARLRAEDVLAKIEFDCEVTAKDIAETYGIPSRPQEEDATFYRKLHAILFALEREGKIVGTSQRFPPRKWRRVPR
jgi:hypothetical protein